MHCLANWVGSKYCNNQKRLYFFKKCAIRAMKSKSKCFWKRWSRIRVILNEGGTRSPTSKYKYCQFNLALLLPSQLFPSDVSASGPISCPFEQFLFHFHIRLNPFSSIFLSLFLSLIPKLITRSPPMLAAICEFFLWIKVDGMGPAMRSLGKRPEIQMIKFFSSASIHRDYLKIFTLKFGQLMIMKRHVWIWGIQ